MIIGVLKETSHETRVSLLPEHIGALSKHENQVWVEQDAGSDALADDKAYLQAGASIKSRQDILTGADVLLSINGRDIDLTGDVNHKILIGVFQPLNDKAATTQLAEKGCTIFSLDMLPRTTRAQSMDVLSSQANIAGYKAVIVAADAYPRYFPMFMTAAGSIAPAKVLILGAGVAGLQAIATAKRLGAVVEVFDTRPAVKEEVQSLGAKFIEVEGAADASQAGGYAVEQSEEYQRKQKERIAQSIAKSDIIITTAQIPGRKAPILIDQAAIDTMRRGSVIVDLAASTGGNTVLTKNNEVVVYNGIQIIGNSSLASTVPSDASKVYGKNVLNFLALLINKEGQLHLNFDDDLVKGACIAKDGKIIHERLLN